VWVSPRHARDSVTKRLVLGVAALALLIAGAVVVLVWDVGGEPATAYPASMSSIAFTDAPPQAGYEHQVDLFVMDPDGSNRRRVARCGTYCRISAYTWSPDGRRLAFMRGDPGSRNTGTDYSLFVVGADGAGERRLFRECGKSEFPGCIDFLGFFGSPISWAPDGSRLVVSRGGSLYVADVDGRHPRRLTSCEPKRCFDITPAWSPDGSRIVFTRSGSRGPLFNAGDLYSVRPDGTDLRRLTHLAAGTTSPTWSPDARKIAFGTWPVIDSSGSAPRRKSGLYVMAADGSNLKRLATAPGEGSPPQVPSWSPDSRRLALLTTPGTSGSYGAEVWVMRADGTERKRLFHTGCCLVTWGKPSWAPEGKLIAFAIGIGDTRRSGLFVVNVDGSGLRRVASVTSEPVWRPIP
jgi:TolB protein